MADLRYLGTDSATGKRAYALAASGGALERMADTVALEVATTLTAVVGEILEVGKASDAELAVFVPTLYESLREVTGVAARLLDTGNASETEAVTPPGQGAGSAFTWPGRMF